MKKPKALPSREELRRMFRLNKETGQLVWRFRDDIDPRVAKRWAGKPAGCIRYDKAGKRYIQIRFHGQSWQAHRLIWQYVKGDLGEDDYIDHKDGDGMNNVFANFRKTTPEGNAKNRRVSSRNTSGYPGLSLHPSGRGWVVVCTLRVGGKITRPHLGRFPNKWAAINAKRRWEAQNKYHKNNGSDRPL